jgi:hypothetical protein
MAVEPPPDPAGHRSSVQLDVPVGPVGSAGGRRRIAPTVGVVALVVVVVGGIALAQAFPAAPVAPVVQSPPIAVATARPEPSPTPGLALPARLDASELVSNVLNGSLDEWLVYADATLRAGPDLAIDGLGLEVLPNPTSPAATVVPAGAVLVLRVRGRQLEYLGSLLTHPVTPSIAILKDELTSVSPVAVQPTLRDARGWLIVRPACIVAASPAPPCDSPPFLADDQPLPDGTRRSDDGATVALAPDIWGVDPQRDTVSPGPFLVRPLAADPSTWEVVARYEPTKSVRVVIP